MNSEMQVCLKLQPSAYTSLVEYPNRVRLGKSKIITFTNNENLFQQRCSLFVQLCCMLLRIQLQKASILLSKNIFIDHNHLIFMLYSFDGSHQGKLRRVVHGNLISSIIEYYGLIFVAQGGKIADYQHNFLYENIADLIHYLAQLKDKSDKYYFQSAENRFHIKNSQIELSNPNSIMFKFQNSPVFKEYFYLLTVSKAIVIKLVADSEYLKTSEIYNTYCELTFLQKNLFSIISKPFFEQDVKDSLYSFEKLVTYLLKLMQQQNCISLNKRQEETKARNNSKSRNHTVLDIEFCSNLRRLPSCPKTAGERSQQSSGYQNNTSDNKEEREERKREKELFQSIMKFENQINFKLEVLFNSDKKYFSIEVEGVSQWCLDQCFYTPVYELWSSFVNSWHCSLQPNQEIPQELKPSKLQFLQRNKNIVIRQSLKIHENCNLVLELIAIIDKIAMIFLLFERNFKYFYKVTHNILLDNEKYYQNIKNKGYIANLVAIHRLALKEYSQSYSRLASFEKRLFYK